MSREAHFVFFLPDSLLMNQRADPWVRPYEG